MRVCLMIEGQEGVTWQQWVALAQTAERSGFEALFRSDHYLSVQGRSERGSLDAWTTLAALAAVTTSIRLGTMVSPTSFRHPSVLAKSVVTADHVSGGRVELGLGAGWLEAEHRAYGFPFHDTRTRMDVLEEQLQIVRGQWSDGAFSFSGKHYELEEVDALPKPLQRPGPPIVIGGSGGPRSLRLAAQYADEYDTVFPSVDRAREIRGRLDDACSRAGRSDRMPLSIMTGALIGSDRADYESRVRRLDEWNGEAGISGAWIAGTVDDAVEQLRALEDAGAERVMLQHLLHEDLDAVELIGREIIPAVA
jgi:F420-dependent oxidoreductase-like protein